MTTLATPFASTTTFDNSAEVFFVLDIFFSFFGDSFFVLEEVSWFWVFPQLIKVDKMTITIKNCFMILFFRWSKNIKICHDCHYQTCKMFLTLKLFLSMVYCNLQLIMKKHIFKKILKLIPNEKNSNDVSDNTCFYELFRF